MGKKKLGGRGGGSNSGSHGAGSSLVVVNPALMQSALKPNAQNTHGKKRKASHSHSKPRNSKKPHTTTTTGATYTKRPEKSSIVTAVVQSALATVSAGPKAPVALVVSREEQLLVAAYWVVLSRAVKRSCVLVVPNSHERLTPQLVASALRHVGFQALALHQKMTPGQRNESVERLASTPQLLLVTTAHLAGATVCADADVLLVGVASQEVFAKFAAVFQVATSGSSSYRPVLTSALQQQLTARLKLATQVAEITQRLALANATDAESKWASKLARNAELAEEDDDNDVEEDEDGSKSKKKKKKKRAKSPDEQRLEALTEKLALLVARRLETSAESARSTGAGGGREAEDTQNGKEKLEALGLVMLSAAVGAALTDERFSAQTRWMDGASGREHGGAWDGAIRHGASKDASSLALRAAYCALVIGKEGSRKHTSTKPSPLVRKLLREWKPNRNPADVDKWGGAFGKACGHNEVVLQSLRPFFPQEVLNSRVCSRQFPAPGNQGFDGCLEHLRLECKAQKRAMTLWDADCFVYVSATGQVTWTKKNQLLQGLSLAALQCLVANLRSWTLTSHGLMPPKRVLSALQLCCALGGGEQLASRLEPALLKRIMSFAVGGSARLWKQIVRVPPLQDEIVYS